MAAVTLLFLTCLCGYFIYCQDKEARRLLALAKNWGERVEDETLKLQSLKVRIVVTYSVTLVVGLFLTIRFCAELWRRF